MTCEKDWDDLRRLARKLENSLDIKLVTLIRLGSRHQKDDGSINEDSLLDMMCMEIEQMLDRLSEVNDKLWNQLHPDLSKEKGSGNTGATLHSVKGTSASEHALQRHREILLDYQREFRRTKDNIIILKEREKLLETPESSFVKVELRFLGEDDDSASSSSTRLLMEESGRSRSSERLVDEQLGVAAAVWRALSAQNTTLKLAKNRVLVSLSQRLPIISTLVYRINVRKRLDALVVAFLVVICVGFGLFLTFH